MRVMSSGGELARLGAAFAEQAELTWSWLTGLDESDLDADSVLAGWDVRTLLTHLRMTMTALAQRLNHPSSAAPVEVGDYVALLSAAAATADELAIAELAVDDLAKAAAAPSSVHELCAAISAVRDPRSALAGVDPSSVIDTGRAALRVRDWARTQLLELVVHSDDLSRSLPTREPITLTRPALADAVRLTAEIFRFQAPGRSVELRVPPFVAVQVVPGPRHTRGTPPNVVETDPVTWLRVATGRSAFATLVRSGMIRASGSRADLDSYLPVTR